MQKEDHKKVHFKACFSVRAETFWRGKRGTVAGRERGGGRLCFRGPCEADCVREGLVGSVGCAGAKDIAEWVEVAGSGRVSVGRLRSRGWRGAF